jgi:hypothetical protein
MGKRPKSHQASRIIKPRRVFIDGQGCVLHSLLRRWTLSRPEVARATVERTTSLFDEIGITVDSDGLRFFVAETTRGFHDMARWLNLDESLGDDWYARVEAGERLEVR